MRDSYLSGIRLLFATVLLACSGTVVGSESTEPHPETQSVPAEEGCDAQRYLFSWNMQDSCAPAARGGTTTGAPVTLAPEPYPGWLSLQDADLSKFERDRRAILAMAGPYRASFEFIETVGYTPGFEPVAPYQSWGTEYVYVVEDQPEFISLQHIMVMFFEDGDQLVGPMVMKHWRQDWRYEDRTLLSYLGNQKWRKEKLPKSKVEGTWTQSVYQVDDSPRYASYGEWEHAPNFSSWESKLTRRPLPRREFSVRDDYDVLEGYNRHTIVPSGWVQEEENYKLRLNDEGEPQERLPYAAKEIGVNRYQRIQDFDFSAGDAYWEETRDYWRTVREEWARALEAQDRTFEMASEVDGVRLFETLFTLAEQQRENSNGLDDARKQVRELLDSALQD